MVVGGRRSAKPPRESKEGRQVQVGACARGSHGGCCKPHDACVCYRFEVPTFKYENDGDKEAYDK